MCISNKFTGDVDVALLGTILKNHCSKTSPLEVDWEVGMVILNFRSVCGGPEVAWSGESAGYEATHVFVKKSALVSYAFESEHHSYSKVGPLVK